MRWQRLQRAGCTERARQAVRCARASALGLWPAGLPYTACLPALPPAQAANEASLCYRDRFEQWEAAGCPVVTTTRSLQQAFDDDDTFAYDPETTGALATGGAPLAGLLGRLLLAWRVQRQRHRQLLPRGASSQARRLTLLHTPCPSYPAAALVLTGGDAEAEAAALKLCKEAEISCILTDSQEQPAVEYLSSTPKTFMRWAMKEV